MSKGSHTSDDLIRVEKVEDLSPEVEVEVSSAGSQRTTVDVSQVDVAAKLLNGGYEDACSAEDAVRVRKKIDRNLIPLMCLLFFLQYMDKITISNAAVLGIEQSTHIDTNQFNWLTTIFYLSYCAFEYPQNLALQRYPVGKWISINVFVWSVALCVHAACRSFGGLLAVRFILGMCEGAVTAGFLIVTSMFYTQQEQMARVGYWYAMTGLGSILLGFIAFGVLHIRSESFAPWQGLMIITGGMTFFVSIFFWFYFPDSPINAKFLNFEEKRIAVLRMKVNETGVENKRFKIEQAYEAIVDPKTWLFAIIVALGQVSNSLTSQRQLIVNMFGFTTLQTTLLGCVDGVMNSITILATTTLSTVLKGFRAYALSIFLLIGILGGVLVITLPFDNRIGLLLSYWVALGINGCVPVLLGWVNSATAGHSKRVTTNGIVLCAYAIGNALGPFMWRQQYRPRNRIPWTIIVIFNSAEIILVMALRAHLASQNANRDRSVDHNSREAPGLHDDTYIIDEGSDGQKVKKRVHRAFLDLTDEQNKEFRYVL